MREGGERSAAARAAFIVTVLLAGLVVWAAPRPGMGDFPEHAAQVTMMRDLLGGGSPWSDLVRLNWFTPYVLGYGLAFVLSFAMPVVAAMKLVLTLAYYAYVAACVALRRSFHGDARLDWLIVPGFFGFAFQYGFYTFLVTLPVAIAFLVLARRFAAEATVARALGVAGAGVFLFFAHGLLFAFACAVGAGFAVAERRSWSRAGLGLALAPYAVLGALAAFYFFDVRAHDPLITRAESGASFLWGWGDAWGWHRAINYPLFAFASGGRDGKLFLAALLFLAAPWAVGWRPNRAQTAALVPFAVLLLIWFVAPARALKTDYLYQRFAALLFPAYLVAFRPGAVEGTSATSRPRRWLARATPIALAIACVAFVALLFVRQRRFTREAAAFETVLAAAEPKERALMLIYAPESLEMRNPYTFHAYGVWYQVERQGFVDFNFAYFLPQIVRFKADRFPPLLPGFDELPESFDWHAVHGADYRYFFVRSLTPLPDAFFANDECRVELKARDEAWSLYQRGECSADARR